VCGRVVGIDLDADDPNKAAHLEALAVKHLGPTPFQRVGRAPRTLLLYRPAATDIIPIRSINIHLRCHGDGDRGRRHRDGPGRRCILLKVSPGSYKSLF
jgi:hypothetical protein